MSEIVDDNSPVQSASSTTTHSSPGEYSTLHASFQLDGKNYVEWAEIVKISLKGRNKLNHILGLDPKKGEAGYDSWDVEDSRIKSWLWNSTQPKIASLQHTMYFLRSLDMYGKLLENLILTCKMALKSTKLKLRSYPPKKVICLWFTTIIS